MTTPPPRSPGPAPFRSRPVTAPPKDRVVFPIGGRVLIGGTTPDQRAVVLLDDKGQSTGATIRVGTQAMITAWKPQRGASTRYRVRAMDGTGGAEGWVEAGNVQRPPPPPPPAPFVRPAAAPVPVKTGGASGSGTKPAAKPSAVAQAAGAPKTAAAPKMAAGSGVAAKTMPAPKSSAAPRTSATSKPGAAAKTAVAPRSTAAAKTTTSAKSRPAAKRSR